MQTNNINQTIQTFLNDAIEKLKTSRWYDGLMVERLLKIPFEISTRMRTRAGSCVIMRNTYTGMWWPKSIIFSREFIMTAPEQEVRDLVSHEFAHAYDTILHAKTDHGPIWKSIDRAMGGSGARCHNVEVKKNKVRRIVITDARNGKDYVITPHRWNKIKYTFYLGKLRFTYKGEFIKGEQAQSVA